MRPASPGPSPPFSKGAMDRRIVDPRPSQELKKVCKHTAETPHPRVTCTTPLLKSSLKGAWTTELFQRLGDAFFFFQLHCRHMLRSAKLPLLILQFPKHQKLDVKVKSANLFTVSCLEPTFHHFTLETANVYSKCVGSCRNLDPTFCHGKAGGERWKGFCWYWDTVQTPNKSWQIDGLESWQCSLQWQGWENTQKVLESQKKHIYTNSDSALATNTSSNFEFLNQRSEAFLCASSNNRTISGRNFRDARSRAVSP